MKPIVLIYRGGSAAVGLARWAGARQAAVIRQPNASPQGASGAPEGWSGAGFIRACAPRTFAGDITRHWPTVRGQSSASTQATLAPGRIVQPSQLVDA